MAQVEIHVGLTPIDLRALAGEHTHTISCSSATQSANHTHQVKVRINGNQAQAKLDLRQKTISLTYYVKL